MNCRKCGCLILETDERCPMCDTKQRRRRDQQRESINPTNEFDQDKGTGSNNRGLLIGVISALGVVVMIGMIGIGFAMIAQDETYTSSNDFTREFEFLIEYRDFDSFDLILLNQANRNKVLGFAMQVFMTEEATYLMTSWGTILRSIDHFKSYELFFEPDLNTIMFSFHVVDGDIYYTTSFSDGRYTPNHVLYRYNFEATHDPDDLDYLAGLSVSNSIRIVENVFSEVIINQFVFYKTDAWESNLYLFDMQTQENIVLIDQPIHAFMVDYQNGYLFFENTDRHLYRAHLDGTNQERLYERILSFASNGEVLAVSTLEGELYLLNLNTNEQWHTTHGALRLRDLIFMGESLIGRDGNDELYLIDLADINAYWIILDNVSPFVSIGNYLLYTQWDEDDINRLALSGQSTFIRPRWEP